MVGAFQAHFLPRILASAPAALRGARVHGSLAHSRPLRRMHARAASICLRTRCASVTTHGRTESIAAISIGPAVGIRALRGRLPFASWAVISAYLMLHAPISANQTVVAIAASVWLVASGYRAISIGSTIRSEASPIGSVGVGSIRS